MALPGSMPPLCLEKEETMMRRSLTGVTVAFGVFAALLAVAAPGLANIPKWSIRR